MSAIRSKIRERNVDVPEERRIEFCVVVNVGDMRRESLKNIAEPARTYRLPTGRWTSSILRREPIPEIPKDGIRPRGRGAFGERRSRLPMGTDPTLTSKVDQFSRLAPSRNLMQFALSVCRHFSSGKRNRLLQQSTARTIMYVLPPSVSLTRGPSTWRPWR